MRTTTRTTAGLLNHTALVVGAVLATAVAATAAALAATETPDIELYLSGATAQDEVLENLLRGGQGGYLAPLTSGFLPPRLPVTADSPRDNPVTGVSNH